MTEQALEWRRRWIMGGALLVLTILVLSLLPVRDNPDPLIPFGDKVNHMLAFVALMTWFSALVPVKRYFVLFSALIAYGALIEVLQYFSGYRYMELGDLLADALGALAGWGLALAGLNSWCIWVERRLLKR